MRRHLPTLAAVAAAAFTLSACQIAFEVGATLHTDLETVDMETAVLMDEFSIAVMLSEEIAAIHGQETAVALSDAVMADGLDAGLDATELTAEDLHEIAYQLFDGGEADPELQELLDEHGDLASTERRERDGLHGQALVLTGLQITDTGRVGAPDEFLATFEEEGLLGDDLRFHIDQDGRDVNVTVDDVFGDEAAAEAEGGGDFDLGGMGDAIGTPFDLTFTLTVPGEVTDHTGTREADDTVRFGPSDEISLTFRPEDGGLTLTWTAVAAAAAALLGIALVAVGLRKRGGSSPTPQVAAAGAGSVLPAGWYPDPQDPNQFRYWDGFQWTDRTGRS